MSDTEKQPTPPEAESAPPETASTEPTAAEVLAAVKAAAGDTAEAVAPEVSVESLQAQLNEANDAFLRAKADVENARRRADDEIQKARKFAVEGFAESLLPVIDSLEAALTVEQNTIEQMREGVAATQKQLLSALERNKVTQINPPSGEKFNPHQHQAISVVPAEQAPNTVVTVLQKGYLIADRVLRPALVTVTAPK
ncbi:nucleotide exchange factor GrpE [Betaproteobacteria bacterium LSUCC0117]|jgi:molecular chaperone GrpE|nr:nucleotide exchange factor GrpE [Betaproteobacteria bacterium LSUCC0117]MDP4671073.1 nucleotide exchange factor GrpE [Burkholderiaceae bacterium]MDP4863127.1 nucleotide exchange factor GrpE [Burkholderiaceae bacterium]